MSTNRDAGAVVGVGVTACAVCCAGPILGFLAALGLGTVAGVALFGSFAAIVGAAVIVVMLVRHRRTSAWPPVETQPVHIARARSVHQQ